MGFVMLLVTGLHGVVSLRNFRNGFLLFVFLYSTFPRLFALGLSEEGFAITGQRVMLAFLFFLFVLRVLYGSADVQRGLEIARENRRTMWLFAILILSRVAGNLLTGRLDVPAATQFLNEFLFSLFVVLMVFTCIRTRRDVYLILLVIALSLIPHFILAVAEFIRQKSIFAGAIELDFESAIAAKTLVQGTVRSNAYRVMGLFQSPLKLMAVICLSVPLLIALLQTVKEANLRNIITATLIMTAPVVYWTGSRTGIMMMVALTGYYCYRVLATKLTRPGRILILAAMALLALFALSIVIDVIINSFLFGQVGGKSSESRFMQYVISFPLILESPWVGYGYARNIVDIVEVKQIDGYYLRIAMEGGFVALGCLLAIFIRAQLMLGRLRRDALLESDYQIAHGIQVSLGVIFVMMLALNMGTSSFYAYLLIGVAIAFDRMVRQDLPALQDPQIAMLPGLSPTGSG